MIHLIAWKSKCKQGASRGTVYLLCLSTIVQGRAFTQTVPLLPSLPSRGTAPLLVLLMKKSQSPP